MANTNKFGSAWDLALGGTDVCGDTFNLNMTRVVSEVRTNCGLDVVVGANSYTFDISGPLGFGSSSTEATCFAAITDTSADAWEWDPNGTGTAAADNPLYSGTYLASAFNISAPVAGPITFTFNGQGTDTTGVPTRDITP